jgi:hypothetical protein
VRSRNIGMYESFFKLNTDPFRLSADHRFCFNHPSYIRAKGSVQCALCRTEGFVKITARLGTAKGKGVLGSLGQPGAARGWSAARREGPSREIELWLVGKVLTASVDIEQKARNACYRHKLIVGRGRMGGRIPALNTRRMGCRV